MRKVLKRASGIRIELGDLVYRFFFENSDISITARVLRYLTAGGLATLMYMLLVILQVELLDLYPVLAIFVASLIIDTSLYLTNRNWVYKSSLEHRTAISRFLVTVGLALVINSCIMALTVDVLGLWYMWGLVGTILILPPTNFLLNFYWVFR